MVAVILQAAFVKPFRTIGLAGVPVIVRFAIVWVVVAVNRIVFPAAVELRLLKVVDPDTIVVLAAFMKLTVSVPVVKAPVPKTDQFSATAMALLPERKVLLLVIVKSLLIWTAPARVKLKVVTPSPIVRLK